MQKKGAIFVALFATLATIGTTALFAASESELDVKTWPSDGFPLLWSRDAPHLEAIWSALEAERDREPSAEPVSDFYLRASDRRKKLKGRSTLVEGRLLRAVRRETSAGAFFDVWVMLPDGDRLPIRVISRAAPEGFRPDDALENDPEAAKNPKYRRERFSAKAIYYRATAYDAGDDFLAAPTFVALDFRAVAPKGAPESGPKKPSAIVWLARLGVVALLGAFWLLARRLAKKSRSVRSSLPKKIAIFLVAASVGSLGLGEEPTDEEFWALALGTTPEKLALETTGERPSLLGDAPEVANRRAIALSALERLSGLLSISALKERGDNRFKETTLGERFALAPKARVDFFGGATPSRVGYFTGELARDDAISLEGAEKERFGFDAIRRFELIADGAPLVVYAALPTTGARGAREYGGFGVYFGRERTESGESAPVVLAKRLAERALGTPLGNAGFDAASTRDSRVYPVKALEREKDPKKRKRIARSLRWTSLDREPFYEALAAVKRQKKIEFAKGEEPPSEVEFFLRPERYFLKGARFTGRARRVVATEVADPDAIAATGIAKYYQLYVYTNDSQGNPLVLCVPDLPKGLTPSVDKKYDRRVDFSGYFYKTWAYKNSETPASDEEEPKPNWTRAPVFVGKITRVYPEEEPAPKSPVPPRAIFVSFAILALAWIVLRRAPKILGARR